MPRSSIHKAMEFIIKQKRSDARRLRVIANHLTKEANSLAKQIRDDIKAEKARANFYSKPSNIDPYFTLTPELKEEAQHEKGTKATNLQRISRLRC